MVDCKEPSSSAKPPKSTEKSLKSIFNTGRGSFYEWMFTGDPETKETDPLKDKNSPFWVVMRRYRYYLLMPYKPSHIKPEVLRNDIYNYAVFVITQSLNNVNHEPKKNVIKAYERYVGCLDPELGEKLASIHVWVKDHYEW